LLLIAVKILHTRRSRFLPSPLAGEGGAARSGAPGEGPRPRSALGPHLIALRAICPLPQGERTNHFVLAMHPHPSFGNERHEVFASKK
jgi:hypothetical protein